MQYQKKKEILFRDHEARKKKLKSIAVNNNEEAIKVIADHIKEEIKTHVRTDKKKRVDKKEVNQLGIVGKTVVANDFRSHFKKKITNKCWLLTQILHDWNMANYNL